MLMTGYADQRERSHELDALVHDVIAKPFSVAQIRGALGRSAGTRPPLMIPPTVARNP
jgi:CheY-like chemotaxis protein